MDEETQSLRRFIRLSLSELEGHSFSCTSGEPFARPKPRRLPPRIFLGV
jgi:hypothetical protein